MKRLLPILLLSTLPLLAQPRAVVTLQNAATATGTGTAWTNTAKGQWIYAVVHTTGAPTGCTIALQTSTTTAGTFANATASTATGFAANPFTCTGTSTDAIIGVYCPSDAANCAAVRANITALSGGTSPTVTATLLVFDLPQSLATITGSVTAIVTAAAQTGADGVTNTASLYSGALGILANGVWVWNGSTWDRIRAAQAYGDSATGVGMIKTQPNLYNGSTLDFQRGNIASATIGITCTACTSTQTGADQTNYNARGVKCVYDATTVTGSGSFTFSIQGKDSVSGKYFTLLTGAAVSTVSTNVYTVYPGITASANVSSSDILPRVWRGVLTYNSGTNQTATIGCAYVN